MKFKPRVTSHESRATNKAFTLIELVVTIALLTMVISFTSVIFNVSIDAHRTSAASAEIMQKFRAITDQLNRDFRSLQKDAPLLIWFRNDANFIDNNRFDQIMFFAAGDFQSIQLYNFATGAPDPVAGTSPLVGNVARIHYAQAQCKDPRDGFSRCKPEDLPKERRILARRRHILTADTRLVPWPDFSDFVTSFQGLTPEGGLKNEVYEHDRLSLAQWKTMPIDNYSPIINKISVGGVGFDFPPWVDKGDPNTFHKLMCEGVGSFAIQWAYWYNDPVPTLSKFRWFPSEDPDGDNNPIDSHFTLMGDAFGVCFNIQDPNNIAGVLSPWHFPQGALNESGTFADFYPRALKFTFTLYDSKGIIKNGREFTHIVYLGD